MNTAPEISKAAFLARINNRARRFAVNTHCILQNGKSVLLIEYDNGDREPFRGLDRAA
jgi:hypothetical protein